jgi:hypothetical protein
LRSDTLFSQFFVEQGKEALEIRLRLLNLFANANQIPELFDKPMNNKDLIQRSEKFLFETLCLNLKDFDSIENFNELYRARIESRFRDPYALLTYGSKINSLKGQEKIDMQTAYSKFVKSLLTDTFDQLRKESPQRYRILKTTRGEEIEKCWSNPPSLKPLEEYLPKEDALKMKSLVIGLSNDACDLILLARETGGCVSIDKSEHSQATLAYITDWKNLALVIKGTDGRTVARKIFRMLVDPKKNTAVLFLENYYSLIPDKSVQAVLTTALNNYAMEFASKLSLDLLTKEDSEEGASKEVYQGSAESVGSNAPREYVDALEEEIDRMTKGKFVIEHSYLMNPKPKEFKEFKEEKKEKNLDEVD